MQQPTCVQLERLMHASQCSHPPLVFSSTGLEKYMYICSIYYLAVIVTYMFVVLAQSERTSFKVSINICMSFCCFQLPAVVEHEIPQFLASFRSAQEDYT